MSTTAQQRANKENAQHSTAPRTAPPRDSLSLYDPAPTEPRPPGRRLRRQNPTTHPNYAASPAR